MLVRKSRFEIARISLLSVLLLVLGMAGRTTMAQNNYGAIVGTVTDATGADVPGTTVILKSAATNATQTVVSGNGGTYSFLNLNPGTYTETFSHNGFESVTKDQVDACGCGASSWQCE